MAKLLILLCLSSFLCANIAFGQTYPEMVQYNIIKNENIERIDLYAKGPYFGDTSLVQLSGRIYITKPGKRLSHISYIRSDTIHPKDSSVYTIDQYYLLNAIPQQLFETNVFISKDSAGRITKIFFVNNGDTLRNKMYEYNSNGDLIKCTFLHKGFTTVIFFEYSTDGLPYSEFRMTYNKDGKLNDWTKIYYRYVWRTNSHFKKNKTCKN